MISIFDNTCTYANAPKEEDFEKDIKEAIDLLNQTIYGEFGSLGAVYRINGELCFKQLREFLSSKELRDIADKLDELNGVENNDQHT